jgi:hypothetical protein
MAGSAMALLPPVGLDWTGATAPPQALITSDPRTLSAAIEEARVERAQGRTPADARRAELTYWLRFFGLAHAEPSSAELEHALAQERAERGADPELERRARWLRDGTSDAALNALDPRRDADQLHQRVLSLFRVESRVLETLAINRIAQSTSLLLLIRATGKSEAQPALRFYDTYSLLSNALEWGVHSARGGRAVRRINDVHARYDIPAEGMKYILLETAFTWLQGADVIAHRPLHEIERLGFFHAYVELGLALGVQGLEHDYTAMQAWVNDFNHTHRAFHPSKRDTFERIVKSSLSAVPYPNLVHWFEVSVRAAMDESYREAVGQPAVTAHEFEIVKRLLFNLGTALEIGRPGPLLRSLSPNPARPVPAPPEALGSTTRSEHLPPRIEDEQLPLYTWQQLGTHCHPSSLWLAIDGEVFDLTHFAQVHPGGREILMAHAGKDASAAFARAGHPELVQTLRRNYRIGRILAG